MLNSETPTVHVAFEKRGHSQHCSTRAHTYSKIGIFESLDPGPGLWTRKCWTLALTDFIYYLLHRGRVSINPRISYKNKYKTDMKCQACGQQTESQPHILRECQTLHQNETSKITEADITTEDTDTLKETAMKIEEIMRRLIADPPGTIPAAGTPADLGRGNAPPQPQ